MTQIEVTKLVAVLLACYPNARVPDGTVVAYETFLVELEHDRAQLAVRDVIRSSKFMPTIAEIVMAYEGQSNRTETPYHRLFTPRRDHGRIMPPTELKAACDAFLASQTRKPPGVPDA